MRVCECMLINSPLDSILAKSACEGLVFSALSIVPKSSQGTRALPDLSNKAKHSFISEKYQKK